MTVVGSTFSSKTYFDKKTETIPLHKIYPQNQLGEAVGNNMFVNENLLDNDECQFKMLGET